MITEDYVGFETAKLLRDCGFEAEVKTWWDDEGNMYKASDEYPVLSNYDGKDWLGHLDFECIAPTLQMATKWLREKYNVHIEIRITNHSISNMFNIAKYYWVIVNTETVKWCDESTCYNVNGFDTPEEAEEDAIIHLLEKMR